MNLIINTVGGQFLTLTPEMLQEKLGLKSDILSLGIEVSDGNTAITAQSYTKWECAGDTICPLIDVNVKNGGKEMQAAMFQLPTPEIPAPFCRLYDEQGSEMREKLREDEIRSLGWEVVRITTELLTERTKLIRRVNAALSRAQRRAA